MQTEKKPAEQSSAFSRFWAWHKERKAKAKEKEKNKTVPQKIMSWVWTIVAALAIALAVHMFIGEPVRVDGTSMTNTLQDGEIVWSSRWAYLTGNPQRNDIVICRYPGRVNETGVGAVDFSAALSLNFYTIFVKRLVALPGDYVQISDGHLYVNNELVEDPEFMASVPRDYPLRLLDEDEYFVIGDNRLHSHDSRYSDVGPISRDALLGKVTYVLLPWGNHRAPK